MEHRVAPYQAVPARPHLNPARFAGVRVPKVGERRVAPPRPTPTGPTSSPASRTTRGKDHPTAHLSGPGAGKVWHRVQELAGRARKRLARGGVNRDVGSLPGTARTPPLSPLLLHGRNQRARHLSHRHTHRGMPQVRYAAAPGKTRPVTAGAGGIPSCHIRLLLRAWRDRLTKRQQERLHAAFTADEAHK